MKSDSKSKHQKGFGYGVLTQLGWSEGKGIGLQENGISDYVKPARKANAYGLGYNLASDLFGNYWWGIAPKKKPKTNCEMEKIPERVKMLKNVDPTYKSLYSNFVRGGLLEPKVYEVNEIENNISESSVVEKSKKQKKSRKRKCEDINSEETEVTAEISKSKRKRKKHKENDESNLGSADVANPIAVELPEKKKKEKRQKTCQNEVHDIVVMNDKSRETKLINGNEIEVLTLISQEDFNQLPKDISLKESNRQNEYDFIYDINHTENMTFQNSSQKKKVKKSKKKSKESNYECIRSLSNGNKEFVVENSVENGLSKSESKINKNQKSTSNLGKAVCNGDDLGNNEISAGKKNSKREVNIIESQLDDMKKETVKLIECGNIAKEVAICERKKKSKKSKVKDAQSSENGDIQIDEIHRSSPINSFAVESAINTSGDLVVNSDIKKIPRTNKVSGNSETLCGFSKLRKTLEIANSLALTILSKTKSS